MIEPETIIDERYRVISRLGSGGMADVYLAQDQLLGRQVAVKVLHHHFAEDQEFVERFRREASSAAGLSHPNIVAIFDRGEWNGTYYIAMEYVAGRALKSIVRETGPLEPAVAIDIVIQILRAAQFAHKRGVIHRDLKPHNVIIDEEARARVTDFGIARAGASDMTLTGSIMGTAQYLSPEQAQGYAVSGASDLYSVGVILYELLTGMVPFEGETAVAIAFKQVSAVPRPPSELNPALPASLDAVVLRALAKDPERRYADAGELIDALTREREALPAFSATTVLSTPAAHAVPLTDAPPLSGVLMAPAASFDEDYGPLPEREGRDLRRAMLWVLAVALIAGAAALAVSLLSSKGSVTVPQVTGESEQAAGAALRKAGLTPVPSLSPSATVPTGLVISQAPSPGSLVKSGDRVSIVVSGGPASAALMNVDGLSASQASGRLRKAGFKPATKAQASTTVKAGRVISTEPPAGTELQLGSSVTMLISSGPAPVRVPDVNGQSLSAAEATLTNAELTIGTVTQKVSTAQSPGTVLSQSPNGGSSVRAGTKIELTVAQAPKVFAVPNVVGASAAAAVATLKHAGFSSKTASRPSSEPSQVGIVLEQSPAAAAHAPKGATVTITVGLPETPTTPPTTPTTTPTTPPTTTPTTPAPPVAPPTAAGG
jgi:beta-lactam-binding protein with PASTA domain